MNWRAVALRILLVCGAGLLLGWYYGYPLHALIAALVGVNMYWLIQMHRVQRWLQHPEQPLPEIYGSWGELLAKIHRLQRLNLDSQEQLQYTVDYFRNSFSAMTDGVVLLDEHGAIAWLNRAAEKLLDLRFPQDQGQSLTNLVRAPEFKAYVAHGDHNSALQYCNQQEPQRYLEVDITHFGDGERLLFVRDVTSKVRLEEIRRDFVGNVSHELRTPLTVITGYLSTFVDNIGDFPPAYQKGLQHMVQQSHRMENLLKDLLWLSRIESDIHKERKDSVDIASLLKELRDELVVSQPRAQIELQVSTAERVVGDRQELYSAIINLVQNAIKYSSEDSVVTVRWRRQNAACCCLDVCDRGPGIDAVHIGRITERFYRIDDSRSSQTGGTGLGLAIVKHVAAAHDARLEILSTLGEGSTFTLIFPIGEQENVKAG